LKKTVLILIYACLVSIAPAQVITIRDQETLRPLELVTLASEDPNASAITDPQGQADITPFKDADSIEIRRVGYQAITTSFSQLKMDGFLLYLIPAIVTLDQIVISATRWSQPKKEIPARITSISPGEIILENPQTTADLLGLSGEVFIQKSQQGGGSPMIRGFATNRLLIVVDGVRMNTAIFRSGNLQNVISLDPFLMERTEVLFGPGSVMYGSDAIAGVMNFNTLTPSMSADGKPFLFATAVARTSSVNSEFTRHMDVNTGWGKWASLTSISSFWYNDLVMGRNGPADYLNKFFVSHRHDSDIVIRNSHPGIQIPTSYKQTNLMQKVRYRPAENWDMTYGIHYSTTSNIPRYDRLIRLRDTLPRSAEWYYGPQVWMMNNLSITHSGTAVLYDELIVRLAHQFFRESRVDRDLYDTERRIRVEKVNAWSANVDLKKILKEKHKLFYGLEIVYDDVQSTGTNEDISTKVTVPGPSRYPQAGWTSLAAYLTWQYQVAEKLLLQSGARYNHFMLNALFDTTFYPFPFTRTKINDGALTGSLGLVYHPSEAWSLDINLSTGFRSPNVDDMGKVFDSEPGSVIVPNPRLGAEYAWNAEAGLTRFIGDWLRIDITGYYTLLDHALVRRDFTMNGLDSIVYDGELSRVLAVQNAARAVVRGAEAALEIRLPAGFGLISHFNYQKGEEELDDGSTSPLRHAAPWFGVTHIQYTAQRLKLDLYAVYNGEVTNENLPPEEQGKAYMYAADKNGNPYSPSWYTLNLKAMYQLAGQLSLIVGMENITSQRYRPYSSGLTGPGRNLIFSLRLSL
jgi:hemoglobin/transferrin/lactoferrin receptor protein